MTDTATPTKTTTPHTSKALGWNRQDTTWMLSLFGTAVGAGVLFLPINAGVSGIIGLIIMAVLAFPITYFSHLGMAHLAMSGKHNNDDITDVVEQDFGHGFGVFFNVMYFFSIFPILLVYGISITNTTQNFLIHQLKVISTEQATQWRWLLSLLLVLLLAAVVRYGTAITVKVMSILVYPFITVIVLFALYLIPMWKLDFFSTFTMATTGSGLGSMALNLFLILPLMIFTFNHSAIISSFAVSQRNEYGRDKADAKVTQIMKRAESMMVIVVMFFVFSCVMATGPEGLAKAKAENVNILSYIADVNNTPVLSYIGPIVAFIAVAKSFMGHYLGTQEGLNGLIRKIGFIHEDSETERKQSIFVELFILGIVWLIAWANVSVIGLIETLIGPIIAFILFLVPMYAFHTVPSLAKYKGKASNVFVTVIGLMSIIGIAYNIWVAVSGQ